jgi:HAD superfamily hydrolase (TIGR01459 family)
MTGGSPIPAWSDCLGELKARGKRSSSSPMRRAGPGSSRACWTAWRSTAASIDGIISSGEVAWPWLHKRDQPWFEKLGRKAFHIGPERDLSVVEDGAAELVATPEEADFLLNTGPDPDRRSKSVEPYRDLLECACFKAGLPMVCVNPDRAVMVGGERLICAGAFADVYLELGGDVLEVGKPDAMPSMRRCSSMLERDRRQRVIAMGDTPHTDLLGAQAAGIDCRLGHDRPRGRQPRPQPQLGIAGVGSGAPARHSGGSPAQPALGGLSGEGPVSLPGFARPTSEGSKAGEGIPRAPSSFFEFGGALLALYPAEVDGVGPDSHPGHGRHRHGESHCARPVEAGTGLLRLDQ